MAQELLKAHVSPCAQIKVHSHGIAVLQCSLNPTLEFTGELGARTVGGQEAEYIHANDLRACGCIMAEIVVRDGFGGIEECGHSGGVEGNVPGAIVDDDVLQDMSVDAQLSECKADRGKPHL